MATFQILSNPNPENPQIAASETKSTGCGSKESKTQQIFLDIKRQSLGWGLFNISFNFASALDSRYLSSFEKLDAETLQKRNMAQYSQFSTMMSRHVSFFLHSNQFEILCEQYCKIMSK